MTGNPVFLKNEDSKRRGNKFGYQMLDAIIRKTKVDSGFN